MGQVFDVVGPVFALIVRAGQAGKGQADGVLGAGNFLGSGRVVTTKEHVG